MVKFVSLHKIKFLDTEKGVSNVIMTDETLFTSPKV